jgi:hypothetical protein
LQGDQIGRIFRLLGRLLTLGRFLKITKVAQIVEPFLSTARQEMGWATFWAIFSKGHLVTLVPWHVPKL